MKNLTGTAVDLREKEEGSKKNYKIKKHYHKPFNPIRNVEKFLLIRDKLRSYNHNNKGNQ
jgi:hypothetical protein